MTILTLSLLVLIAPIIIYLTLNPFVQKRFFQRKSLSFVLVSLMLALGLSYITLNLFQLSLDPILALSLGIIGLEWLLAELTQNVFTEPKFLKKSQKFHEIFNQHLESSKNQLFRKKPAQTNFESEKKLENLNKLANKFGEKGPGL